MVVVCDTGLDGLETSLKDKALGAAEEMLSWICRPNGRCFISVRADEFSS